jgi:hypothetical protein
MPMVFDNELVARHMLYQEISAWYDLREKAAKG